MAARNYSSVARATTLTASVSGSATTLFVTETTGFPSVPFTLVADPGRSTEEAITVTNQTGLTLTVLRGQDGTAAQPHDAGATLRHMATARDFREPADHLAATADVHGVTGSLVGATQVQSVDNKTYQATLTDHTPLKVKAAIAQTAPLLVFSDVANATVASVGTTGRLTTPGVDGTNSSTFTAGAASTVPLIAKGTTLQSAKLFSARDSANAEKASIDVNGTVTGVALTAPNITGTTITSTDSMLASTVGTAVPLVAKTASGSSARAFEVRDSTNVVKAGVTGDTTGYRLFQGSSNNFVPFRIHSGTLFLTIASGTSSINGGVDISSYGYDVAPLVFVSVVQNEDSALQRRVAATVFEKTATDFRIRVFQTAGENVPANTNYAIAWMAVQMTPSAGIG